MNKEAIIKALKNKKTQDYTYAIMFFLVSAAFAVFVIRPVLGIAIAINREGKDLERINKVYEQNITTMLELQSQIEALRSKKYLLQEALPNQPNTQEVITDLQRAASEAGVVLNNIQIQPIVLKAPDDTERNKVVTAEMKVGGSFDTIDALIQQITNQRRIKTVRSLSLTALNSGETELGLVLELDAHYINQQQ